MELNYSSDIDLIFICESEGQTNGPRPISNIEFFDLVARELVRQLTERTELGSVYRVRYAAAARGGNTGRWSWASTRR